jgi:hypothetical protein
MLTAKLLSTIQSAGNLEFVGGSAASSTGQTPSYSLTSLTGGLASFPSAGDIVIVAVGFSNNTDRNILCSGYTELVDSKAPLGSSQMGVFYKILGSAETSVSFDLGVSENSVFAVHAWRNPSSTQPDATTTTYGTAALSSLSIDAPAITTVTGGSAVLAFAFANSTATAISTYNTPSGMENLFQAATGNARIVVASVIVASPSSYDPATFGTRGGGNGSSTGTSFVSATAAIRPA